MKICYGDISSAFTVETPVFLVILPCDEFMSELNLAKPPKIKVKIKAMAKGAKIET